MDLNNKQSQILELIFTNPIPYNILWKDIESLFIALGADITQGKGSRVRVKLNDVKAVFHEPHPKMRQIKEQSNLLENFLLRQELKYDEL